MQTSAEVMARVHLAKAEEYWRADRLEAAHAAMVLALRTGIPPSDVYDVQRAIEAELAARRQGCRWRVTEHLELEVPASLPVHVKRRVFRVSHEAWMNLTAALDVRWGKPVLMTFFPSHEASTFLHARYGYYMNRTELHKICLPFGFCGQRAELGRAVLHEVTHAALHDAAPDQVPRWLDEGLAVCMEGGPDPAEAGYLRDLALQGRVPSMGEVSSTLGNYGTSLDSASALAAYGAAGAFVGYLWSTAGSTWPVRLLQRLRRGEDVAAAFRAVVGATPRAAEAAWRRTLDAAKRT